FAAAHALSVVEQLMDAAPVKSLFYEIKEGTNYRSPLETFWGRWGMLTSDNRPKAVYNAFKMLSHMEGLRLPVESEETGIRAIASRGKERVNILVWEDRVDEGQRTEDGGQPSPNTAPSLRFAESHLTPNTDTPVRLRIRGLPWKGATGGAQWVVDAAHGNA